MAATRGKGASSRSLGAFKTQGSSRQKSPALRPGINTQPDFSSATTSGKMSFFESAPLFPKDAIFALTAQYNNDASPVKVNLGQGSYRDENGLPWVLPSVREARRRVSSQKLDHEYLPILGFQNFRSAVGELVLGSEAHAAIGNRVCLFRRPPKSPMLTILSRSSPLLRVSLEQEAFT